MTEEIIQEPEGSFEEELKVDFPERPPYTQEELINADALRNTSFKAELLQDVDESLLYESAKRALRKLIRNYFNATWFLANLEKGDKDSGGRIDEMMMTKLIFEIDVIASSASFCKSDVNSADMLNIINALRSHFKLAILSRAKGPNRERMINKLTSIEQILTKKTETNVQQKERKKGILG